MTYDWVSLDFIYYPVSALLWFWHKVFGMFLGADSGLAWALAVAFLVFTIRTILVKGVFTSIRTTRQMKELQPQIKALQKKYGKDRQRMAVEMQKLQREHGFNPILGCLPALLQAPVFLGLFHVVRSFNRTGTGPTDLGLDFVTNANTPNYVFSAADVQSFLQARMLGVPLSAGMLTPSETLAAFGPFGGVPGRLNIVVVAACFILAAAAFTHANARTIIGRQDPDGAVLPQTATMNRLMLWVFPLGIVVSGPFFHIAVLVYWLSNNVWTYGQNRYIGTRLSTESPWKRYEAASDLSRAERAANGERLVDIHRQHATRRLALQQYRQGFAHFIAAGNAAAGHFGSSHPHALNNYLWAADVARFRRQEREYKRAIAKVYPLVNTRISSRSTTPAVSASLIVRHCCVTVGAERAFGRKVSAARRAAELLPWLRGLLGVGNSLPKRDAVQNARAEFRSLALVAAYAIPEPGASPSARRARAKFATAVGVQLVAAGKQTRDSAVTDQGGELIATVGQLTRETSGGLVIWDTVKVFAIDYARSELEDAVLEVATPYIEGVINDGISVSLDIARALW